MLDVKLLPKQWEVFHTKDGVDFDIKLYQGGVGAGKTFLGALTGNKVLKANPGATWLVVADTWERLKLTTWETWFDLLDGASIKFKANKSDHVITIPGWDNARVIFKGLEDPFSLRSVNGIGAHVEEASMLSEAAFLELLGRLRQAKSGTPINVILTTNPQTTRGWLHTHFVEKAGIEKTIVRGKEVAINRQRVIARTIDNPHVSDAFIGTLETSYDEDMYRIMVLGEDGDYTAGLVCKSWSRSNIERTPYRPERTIYLSCDFNIDPNCWVMAHRFNNEYHYFGEMCLENSTTVQSAEEFYRRYGKHEAGVIITGDSSGQSRSTQAADALTNNYTIIRNTLSGLGMRNIELSLRNRNPEIQARTTAWNAAVKNSLGVQRVFVDPSCKWLIWNCENLRYIPGSSVIFEPTLKMIEKDPKLKFTKHVWDAASYLVERYDPVKLDLKGQPQPRFNPQPFRTR
jgi:PBSX family phage terminase large subunit